MTTILSAVRVDGPAPVARPYGLLQSPAVVIVEETDERWLGGVTAARYILARGDVTGDPCVLSSVAPFSADRIPGPNDLDYAAFGVALGGQCAPAGMDWADFKRRLQVSLEASDGVVVESQFQYPANGFDPSLASDATVITGGGLALAVANLEQKFADVHGSLGVLHISPKYAVMLAARGGVTLVQKGNGWVTVNGTPVVIGGGYTGKAPNGQTANDSTHEYAYITGPVQVRRSSTQILPGAISEALDRDDNTVTAYAVRYYSLLWDSDAVYAAKADLTTL